MTYIYSRQCLDARQTVSEVMDTLQIVFATLSLSVPVLLGWLLHSVSTLHRDVSNLVGSFEQMDKRVGNIESKLNAA